MNFISLKHLRIVNVSFFAADNGLTLSTFMIKPSTYKNIADDHNHEIFHAIILRKLNQFSTQGRERIFAKAVFD